MKRARLAVGYMLKITTD